MSSSKLPEALLVYVRSLFAERRASGVSLRAIGKEFEISHAYVHAVLDPEKQPVPTIGIDLQRKIAAKLHGGSIDTLEKHALAYLLDHPPGETIELDPRYPNRSKAIRMACEGLNLTPEQAERLAPVALDAEEDQEVFWWLDQIRANHSAEKKGVRRMGVREVTDD